MARWTFSDPVAAETYSFEVNPNEGGSPSFEKTITYSDTAGPGGDTIIFEGRDKVQEFEFSGVLLSEQQYYTFVTWFEKRRQIDIEDDLGRTFTIYITAFQPRRNRKVIHPWHHTYSVKATILNFG